METLFLEAMQHARQQRKLLAVYTDKEATDQFSAGYVHAQVEGALLLHSFDSNGFEDGLIFFQVDQIYLVEIDSLYLKNLGTLISALHQAETNTSFVFEGNEKESALNDFLHKCFADQLLVTIKLHFDKGVSGFITKMDAEIIGVNTVTSEGEEDGLAYFKIEDIDRIYVDGIDQRRMQLLLAKKNK